ncbi:MAG: hypothetical protein AB7V26_06020 [Lysobacterales bacterium]
MAKEFIIATVGTSDEQVSHLRLLVRQACKKLPDRWRFGLELNADLVVVDPNSFAGHMARTRAQASGVRCALLCDADYPERDGLILREPLQLDDVLAVLQQAVLPTVAIAPVTSAGEDFYYSDLTDAGHAPGLAGGARPLSSGDAPALGLDELLKSHSATRDVPGQRPAAAPNPIAEGLDALFKSDQERAAAPMVKGIRLDQNTAIAATGEGSSRAEVRKRDAVGGFGRHSAVSADHPNIQRILEADHRHHSIRDCLDGESTLAAPSSIEIAGAPRLAIDPKNRVFHANGGLSRLVGYCGRTLPRKDWKVLTTRELNDLREREPARRCEELFWLEALLASNGRLASHLDPGGSYRLKNAVSAEPDFHGHGAIVAAMQQPARLNEIAASAGTSMDAVFNLVNAYDAIGEIEWTPRQRRPAEPPPSEKKGLFGKLGMPFRRK